MVSNIPQNAKRHRDGGEAANQRHYNRTFMQHARKKRPQGKPI